MNEWIFLTPLQSTLRSTTRLDHGPPLIKILQWFPVALRTNPRLLPVGLANSQTSPTHSHTELLLLQDTKLMLPQGSCTRCRCDRQHFPQILPRLAPSLPLGLSSIPGSSETFPMTPFTDAPAPSFSLSQTPLLLLRALLSEPILFICFLSVSLCQNIIP